MTQTPQEFYTAIETLISQQEIPDIKTKRVKHVEKGVLSAKREYLQISGHNHFFDVCAACIAKDSLSHIGNGRIYRVKVTYKNEK
jgi:hypothetical protein